MSAPQPPRCPLGRLVANTVDYEQLKSDAWKKQKILVVSVDDSRLGWADREFIRQIGNKLFKKKGLAHDFNSN